MLRSHFLELLRICTPDFNLRLFNHRGQLCLRMMSL